MAWADAEEQTVRFSIPQSANCGNCAVSEMSFVKRIITNLGVLDVVEGGLRLVELADGVSKEEFHAATDATIIGR